MSMLTLSGPGGPFLDAGAGPAGALRAMNRKARARLLRRASVAIGAVGMAVFAAAATAAMRAPSAPVAEPASTAAPRNDWVEVRNPLRFYSLESAEFGKSPRMYEARRHATGGGRRDILTFGPSVPGSEAVLRLSIYRKGAEEAASGRFFVEMARQAAQTGFSVTRSAQPGDMPSRFGVFETADLTLNTPAGEAACLGFRLGLDHPGLEISGYACGAPSHPIDRRALTCALDRLDLASVGDDRELGRFFANAELARGAGCGGARGGGNGASRWLEPVSTKPALRAGDASRKPTRK